ncbi:MAG: hypothetical protein IT462_03970 [Planctomycetes bacterium]|nr:hypothetical protein [Planctomycetota bacterium]
MSVEQNDIFDMIGVEFATGLLILTITDYLEWDDFAYHALALKDKIQMYVRVTLTGRLPEIYHQAVGKRVVIDLVCRFEPSDDGLALIGEIAADVQRKSYLATFQDPAGVTLSGLLCGGKHGPGTGNSVGHHNSRRSTARADAADSRRGQLHRPGRAAADRLHMAR